MSEAPERAGPASPNLARLALPFALALVLVSALRWVLADLITPFGWSLLAIATWAGALFTVIAILALRRAPEGAPPRPAAPALLIVLGALVAMYGPWAELDLQARWRLQRDLRARAVEWVRSERPRLDERSRVLLPPGLRWASATGGDVRVSWTEADTQAVLFYTYRGVPSGWAGFLYAPSDSTPQYFGGDTLLMVRPMEPRWFFVAAR